jgi:hypothetical protein
VLPDLIAPLTRENGSFYLQHPDTPLIRVMANVWNPVFKGTAQRRVHRPRLPVRTNHRLSGKPATTTTPHQCLLFCSAIIKKTADQSQAVLFSRINWSIYKQGNA